MHELVKVDGHEVWALREKFSHDISDIEYFETLGRERDWIVISKDRANAKRKPERAAILNSGVLAFYLNSSVQKQRINEQAATLMWQWDKLLLQRKTNENGLFELPVGKGTRFKSL